MFEKVFTGNWKEELITAQMEVELARKNQEQRPTTLEKLQELTLDLLCIANYHRPQGLSLPDLIMKEILV